jgi:hypothetical protein
VIVTGKDEEASPVGEDGAGPLGVLAHPARSAAEAVTASAPRAIRDMRREVLRDMDFLS